MSAARVIGLCVAGSLLLSGQASAFYGFGKNKLPHGHGDWLELEVGAYRLVFPQGFQKQASLAASILEQASLRVENLLGVEPSRPVPIVLYGSFLAFQDTKILPYILPESVGGFTEYVQGRIALPNMGSFSEVARVLTHELVHALMLQELSQAALDRRRLGMPQIPSWFAEGVAQYVSGPWTAEEEMVLVDALLDGGLVRIDDLWRWEGSYVLYCAGHSLVRFLVAEFGEGVIAELLQRTGEMASFSQALETVTGMSTGALSAAWTDWLGRQAVDVWHRQEAEVTFTPVGPAEGALSPAVWGEETDSLVYLSYGRGYSSVWALFPPDSLRPGATHRQLVKAGGREGLESLHLFRSRLGTSATGKVAFVAKAGERDVLYVLDGRTGAVVGKWAPEGLISLASPCFAPSESLIAFSAMDTAGVVDIYLVHLRDGTLERLTWDVFWDGSPSFSPDGGRLVFPSDRSPHGIHGALNLFCVDLASGRLEQLTCGPWVDRDPVWSPVDSSIAFVSDRGGAVGLWEVRGTEARPLVTVKGGAMDPAWSRDGQRLYFTVYRHGTHRLYVAERSELSGVWAAQDSSQCGGFWEEPPPPARPFQRYKPRYGVDLAGGILSYDPTLTGAGGASIILSDVVGEKRLYAHVSNSAETSREFWSSFNVALAYADLGPRVARSVAAFRMAVQEPGPLGEVENETLSHGVAVGLSTPLSRFHRVEVGTSVRRVSEPGADRTELYTEAAYARDTALWGVEGPWDGHRVGLKVQGTWDAHTGTWLRVDMFADARYYLRLSKSSSLAHRLQYWYSGGEAPRRFALGGAASLRGWQDRRMVGRQRVLFNLELRFPLLAAVVFVTPAGSLEWGPLRGALFFDAGRAWNSGFPGLVGSVGGGLRLNLADLVVLRVDRAYPTDFRGGLGRPRTQFFLGWSY